MPLVRSPYEGKFPKLYVIFDGVNKKFLNRKSKEWVTRKDDFSDIETYDLFSNNQLPFKKEFAPEGVVFVEAGNEKDKTKPNFLESVRYELSMRMEDMMIMSGMENRDYFLKNFYYPRKKYGSEKTIIYDWYVRSKSDMVPPELEGRIYGRLLNSPFKPGGTTTIVNKFIGVLLDLDTYITINKGSYVLGEPLAEYEQQFPNAKRRLLFTLLPPQVKELLKDDIK